MSPAGISMAATFVQGHYAQIESSHAEHVLRVLDPCQ